MFQRHSILHTPNDSIKLLIIDVDFKSGKVAYYDLKQQPHKRKTRPDTPKKSSVRPTRIQRKPLSASLDEFNQLVSHYDYSVELADYKNGLYVPAGLSKLRKDVVVEERTQAANENYELIKPIVEDKDKFYEYLHTDRGNQHIKEISRVSGVKEAQISRLLAQYCYRGRSYQAMFPNYRYCGCNYQPVAEATSDTPKRGRTSKLTHFRNRLPNDEKLIQSFLRKLGKRLFNRFNYTQQYRLYDFYNQSNEIVVEDKSGDKSTRVVPRPQSECISFAQFYAYIKQLESDRTFAWSKNGDKSFLKEYESRFGRARDGVHGPSFRYEIDATLEDVYLVFPYMLNQRLSSGRPMTYRVSCVYSGMTVGIHIGIGGPNWQGAMQALYNAFNDKVAFCQRFGIDITPEQWPCNVVCNELTIDNGVEYPKKNMDQLLAEELGIDCINYTAIYSGKGKGGVEGGFEQDKKELVQFLPGYVERLPEKGTAHASRFATYTYKEFMRLLIVQTIIRNNDVYKENIHDQIMSEAGVGSTSLEVWNFGMKHYMNDGRGKRFSESQLLFALLPSGNASTTAQGIKFKGLYYNCSFANSQCWLTDSKSRTVKKLEVRYFDGSTNQIWYRHEGKVYTAELNSHSEIYKNRSWFDTLHRLKFYDIKRAEQKEKERHARFNQQQITSEMTAEAKSRLEGNNGYSSKSPQKNMSTVAYIEKKMQQGETASLFREVLLPSDTGQPELSTGSFQMPAQSKTKQQNLEAMYGEEKK
jgi:putative transposase